jgi:hypothetical protein
MMPPAVMRPTATEYSTFYAGYVQRVPEGDIFDFLRRQPRTVRDLLSPLSDEQANFRYAPDQWTIKEVMGHICDVERVFSYRALRISRADTTPLPGFDQDDYVDASNFSTRSLGELVEAFDLLRRANLLEFSSMSEAVSLRLGTASGHPVSVRALMYMMVGHVDVHLESLRTEYISQLKA